MYIRECYVNDRVIFPAALMMIYLTTVTTDTKSTAGDQSTTYTIKDSTGQ